MDKSFEMSVKARTRNKGVGGYDSSKKSGFNPQDSHRSPSDFSKKKYYIQMQSTLAPFESLEKSSSRAVLDEIFNGKHHNASTIAATKFPCIGFSKQTARKSLVNLKENPHEGRFKNINRFPNILSTNKNTNAIVSWDQGKKSSSVAKSKDLKEWLTNQLTKEKKGFIHKFKKKELLKHNQNHL